MKYNEEWKKISDYPNYSISNTGKVRNDITNTILRPDGATREGQTLAVKLKNDDGYKKLSIAKLVGKWYIPNKNGSKNIIHIDKNRKNNCVDNLRWSKDK